jgi:hypothetical protein
MLNKVAAASAGQEQIEDRFMVNFSLGLELAVAGILAVYIDM